MHFTEGFSRLQYQSSQSLLSFQPQLGSFFEFKFERSYDEKSLRSIMAGEAVSARDPACAAHVEFRLRGH